MDVGHQLPVRRQLAVLDQHAGALGSPDPHASPAGDVAPGVVDRLSVPSVESPDGLDRIERPHGRHHLRPQRTGPGNRNGRTPPLGGKSGLAPAVLLQAGVVQLAVARVVVHDRTAGGPPALVGHDPLGRTVAVPDREQRDRLGLPDPFRAVQSPYVGAYRAVLTATEHDPDRIASPADHSGHVVSHVKRPLVKIGPSRIEHMVADPASVQISLIIAQSADIQIGRDDLPSDGEFLAHQRRRIVAGRGVLVQGPDRPARADEPRPGVRLPVLDVAALMLGPLVPPRLLVAGGDPFGPAPVFLAERPHAPAGRLAPATRAIVGIPYPHFPVALGKARERLSAVFDLNAAARGRFPAVPQVALSAGEQLGRRGDQHPVSRLAVAAQRRRHDPAQPGTRRIDSQRIGQILAAQASDLRRPARKSCRQQQDGYDQSFHSYVRFSS